MEYILVTAYYLTGVLTSFYIVSLFHKHVDPYDDMTLEELLTYMQETNDINDELIQKINQKYLQIFHHYDSLISHY